MKRLFTLVLFALCTALVAPVMAGNSSGSFGVSVVVVPPQSERMPAPSPQAGLRRMENARGEHWIVEAPAAQALLDYTAQLQAAGYHPIDRAGHHWSNGSTAVMVSAQDAISTKPISRLSVLAYDIQRQQARLTAAHTNPPAATSPGLLAYNNR